ncbi:MAG TPA: FAD-linked oxidase C-terminal domain-containing protein [Planctomycetaceae bacterium]|nr:FAD-linked oxidase C-terminal domain-containing protein [Planctomycetaceae bacterium]
MTSPALEPLLRRCVTRGRILTAPAQLAGYDADGLGYKTFRPDAVVIPADASELIRIVQHAREWDVPVCLRGAGTSLSGGPVAAQGGVVIHTSALRNIPQIHREGLWCEAECSVTLRQLEDALLPHGLFYPPDPSSGPVCTLGGNVAMNAGGAHCFRYGVTSNYILGVEAVLLDGSVHRFGGPAGGRGPWREDWKRFMVGSEGTLAAFTRFWLRLLPIPEKVWTFRATYPDLITAERAIHALVVHSSNPVAIELMDPRCVAMVENSPMAVGLPKDAFMLLTEIDGPAALVNARVEAVAAILRDAGARDVVFSDEAEQRKKLWKARKVAGGLMGQLSADFVVQDAVIPKRALAELLQLVYDEADAAGIRAVNVFHAGDGNLHPNFLFDSRIPGQLEQVEHIGKRLMQRVVDVGGTLSGEHGIGNDKTAYMPLVFGADSLRLQLTVPAIFNPRHQFNPLKVFDTRRFQREGEAPVEPKAIPGQSMSREATAAQQELRPPVTNAAERLFTPFIDEIDGILCLSADATANEIQRVAQPHRLRFPLLFDETSSLRDHVQASGFAPASSRFGPYCDNIVGMNWRLPSGKVIRVGERVVKTTTGYDLFRFLLGSGDRFGAPIDYVLRLRPMGDFAAVCWFDGTAESLAHSVSDLLHDSWMNWFESIDYVIENQTARLRIGVNALAAEWPVYHAYLAALATRYGLNLHVDEGGAAPRDGRPDLVLKTTTELVINLAREITALLDVKAIALCYPAVVHVYCDLAQIQRIIDRTTERLHAAGGDWYSRHLPPLPPNPAESAWISHLEQACRLP